METKDQEKFIGTSDLSVVEAMQRIDNAAEGIIFIVDDNGRLIGSLTDGDVRRYIIRTGGLDGNVGQMMHEQVRYILKGEEYKANKFLKEKSIRAVPVVDENYHIIDIITEHGGQLKAADSKELKGVPVIVMAGGKGTRLYPYTKILPKPLIPIGGIPILERILNRLYEHGAEEFYLTVNYKKEMIKSYFIENNPPYSIHYIEEDKPLGTAGSIRLIEKQFDSPVIVTNCDSLIEVDYSDFLQYHLSSQNDMTIVSSLKNVVIPYGVLETKKHGIIVSMHEKPQISQMINTGMYIINPEFLEWIPEDRVFHMTDLAEKMMKAGKQVGLYPISESSFLDMGEFEEMKKMEERINNGSIN